jgi:hypothetical protein
VLSDEEAAHFGMTVPAYVQHGLRFRNGLGR